MSYYVLKHTEDGDKLADYRAYRTRGEAEQVAQAKFDADCNANVFVEQGSRIEWNPRTDQADWYPAIDAR